MLVPAIRYGFPPRRKVVPERCTNGLLRCGAAAAADASSAELAANNSRRFNMVSAPALAHQGFCVSAINLNRHAPGRDACMWKKIAAACLVFALAAATQAQAAPAPTAFQSPFHRGVNVLGYDPYWTQGGQRRFEWRHFAEIRRGGFDFVRLNLQAFSHMDKEYRLDPAWLAKLDDAVREAQKA